MTIQEEAKLSLRRCHEKMARKYGWIRKNGNLWYFRPAKKYNPAFVGCNVYDLNRDALLERIYNWCCLTPWLGGLR